MSGRKGSGTPDPTSFNADGAAIYTSLFLALLKGLFFIYDLIVYLPYKLFANPADKIAKSERVKAKPVIAGDPASPWRDVGIIDKELDNILFPNCDTLAKVWEEAVRQYGNLDCMGTRDVLSVAKETQKNGKVFEKWEMGEYHFRTYAESDKRVNLVASGLTAIGQKEKDPVVIYAETREEWMTTALACFKNNHPIVTVYATLGEEAVEFAMNEVGATTIFTTANLVPKVYKAIDNGVPIKNVIYYPHQDPVSREKKIDGHSGAQTISFDELINLGSPEAVALKPQPDDIAMIMYTSGTTGNPKGVMLTHHNIVAANAAQCMAMSIGKTDTYIAYLPLAHILEVCGEVFAFTVGSRLGYSSAQTLFDGAAKVAKGTSGDCRELKPTVMAAVPAVIDRIYKAVTTQINSHSTVFREVFKLCFERKTARHEAGYCSPVLDKLLFNNIGKLLGGKVRWIVSGGAPLSMDTQRFMNICFSCKVTQAYGLTETCGGATIADEHDLTTGSVGAPIRCNEILLREWPEAGYSPHNERPQGEVLISGENVAIGYYKNPEKTKEDFIKIDGKQYFATGDIGEFRPDGSLKIIDRKKDLLKLAHGEYISLGKVETTIVTHPLVDNICVYGDSQKDYLVALVVPEKKNFLHFASQKGLDNEDYEELCLQEDAVTAFHKELLSYIGSKLQRVEIPQRIHLCHEVWTPQTGMLTEALKLKRKNIESTYRDELDKLYRS